MLRDGQRMTMYHPKPNPNKLIIRILMNRFRSRKNKVPCPQRKNEESKDGSSEVSTLTPSVSEATPVESPKTPETKTTVDEGAPLALRDEETVIITTDQPMCSEATERCDAHISRE